MFNIYKFDKTTNEIAGFVTMKTRAAAEMWAAEFNAYYANMPDGYRYEVREG